MPAALRDPIPGIIQLAVQKTVAVVLLPLAGQDEILHLHLTVPPAPGGPDQIIPCFLHPGDIQKGLVHRGWLQSKANGFLESRHPKLVGSLRLFRPQRLSLHRVFAHCQQVSALPGFHILPGGAGPVGRVTALRHAVSNQTYGKRTAAARILRPQALLVSAAAVEPLIPVDFHIAVIRRCGPVLGGPVPSLLLLHRLHLLRRQHGHGTVLDPEAETELSIYVNCGQQFSPHLVLLDCRPQPIRQFVRLQVAGGGDAVV